MTKDKLLQLYNIFIENDIDVKNISKLKRLRNDEIDLLLGVDNYEYLFLVKKLISNKNFKKLDTLTKESIISIINDANGYIQVKYLVRVLMEKRIIESDYFIDIIKIISNSGKGFQAKYVADFVINNYFDQSNLIIEIAKILSNVDNEINARSIYCLSFCEDLIYRGIFSKLANLINKITGEVQLLGVEKILYGYRNFFDNEDLIRIIEIVGNYYDDYQVEYALLFIMNDKLLKNKNIINYLQEIGNDYYDLVCKSIYSTALNSVRKDKYELGVNFWDLYKIDPNGALEIMDEYFLDNEEIDCNKKVRRRYKRIVDYNK